MFAVRQATRATSATRLSLSATARSASSIPLDLEHGSSPNVDVVEPGAFRIQTFNKISEQGLQRFPSDTYSISDSHSMSHAILLRSHKLSMDEVPQSCRAVARCGAGTNNVPVTEMTKVGIPVFNTPGANANAVKELVLAGLLLSSRDIMGGMNHMKELGKKGEQRERVEKDKALFGGREIAGKTLGVIGLGHIGSATARDAAALGMDVIGYDPGMTIESALKLPRETQILGGMKAVFAQADYISLNIPFINKSPEDGGTKGIIGAELLAEMKNDATILNFARGELVDSAALKAHFDAGHNGKYVTDFPEDLLWDHDNAIVIPHLGASTEEAEDAAAAMAAETIMRFLTTGEIVNSVNFPTTLLEKHCTTSSVRIAIVNQNVAGSLAQILAIFGQLNLNIMQQVNKSRGDVAYNVVDVELVDGTDWPEVQKALTTIPEVISSRFILGDTSLGGFGYAVNDPEHGYSV